MTTRLTYTSGALDAALDQEFELQLERARAVDAPLLPHVIGGEDVHAGAEFERRAPAWTDEVASRAGEADAATVERAVAAARAAQPAWAATPYERRCELLVAATEHIASRHMEIAAIVSLETGKNRVESIAEVQEGIDLITTYCADIRDRKGYTVALTPLSADETNSTVLRPYGVFGAISPFNFPFALAINMAVAAIVAGNAAVLKPSEEAPWSGALVGEALAAGGLPAGVFNIVHGGADTGQALVDSSVDGIAFTGSAAVGRAIARKLQDGPFARPALTEMGGKNPAIVAASADLDRAAEGVARAAYGLSGQKCSACSRAIVVESVADEFAERLAKRASELVIGDPLQSDAFVGPVINGAAVERFDRAVDTASRDGEVIAGGERADLPGHYVQPTVVDRLPHGHALTRDELFLPFVTITRVATLDDAIDEANAIDYGLSAGIFTNDDAEAQQFLDRIEAGVVYVNRRAGATTGAWPGAQSFCGWKSSGSTGKGGLGPWYVPQFMREQSRTIVAV
jgi:1-pyrroline-5-carboxylate dehydrogenase